MEVPIIETIIYLKEIDEKMALHSATRKINLYNGDKEGFLIWMNELEVQILIHSFSNANIVKLVLKTTKGPIANFILTFLDGIKDTPSADLKAHLFKRYRLKVSVGVTEK